MCITCYRIFGDPNRELWFTSERPAKLGGENIYISRPTAAGWSSPVLAPPPINSEGTDMQPFFHGNTLYFSSDRDTGRMAIYASQRNGDGWTRPAMVVSSQYGVGEPTLTADGRSLYFAQIFKDGKRHNMDVMVTERK